MHRLNQSEYNFTNWPENLVIGKIVVMTVKFVNHKPWNEPTKWTQEDKLFTNPILLGSRCFCSIFHQH